MDHGAARFRPGSGTIDDEGLLFVSRSHPRIPCMVSLSHRQWIAQWKSTPGSVIKRHQTILSNGRPGGNSGSIRSCIEFSSSAVIESSLGGHTCSRGRCQQGPNRPRIAPEYHRPGKDTETSPSPAKQGTTFSLGTDDRHGKNFS